MAILRSTFVDSTLIAVTSSCQYGAEREEQCHQIDCFLLDGWKRTIVFLYFEYCLFPHPLITFRKRKGNSRHHLSHAR